LTVGARPRPDHVRDQSAERRRAPVRSAAPLRVLRTAARSRAAGPGARSS
jgi:hypothetical protein